jgi:hypothetical protein
MESTWSCTIWRENAADTNALWPEQCLQLLRQMPFRSQELFAADPEDISIVLDIAVFYKTAYTSIALPHELIQEMATRNVVCEITTYPVSEENAVGPDSSSIRTAKP